MHTACNSAQNTMCNNCALCTDCAERLNLCSLLALRVTVCELIYVLAQRMSYRTRPITLIRQIISCLKSQQVSSLYL